MNIDPTVKTMRISTAVHNGEKKTLRRNQDQKLKPRLMPITPTMAASANQKIKTSICFPS